MQRFKIITHTKVETIITYRTVSKLDELLRLLVENDGATVKQTPEKGGDMELHVWRGDTD